MDNKANNRVYCGENFMGAFSSKVGAVRYAETLKKKGYNVSLTS